MLGLNKFKMAGRVSGTAPGGGPGPGPDPTPTVPTSVYFFVSSYTPTSVLLYWSYVAGTSGPSSRTYYLEISTDNSTWSTAPGFTSYTSDSPTNSFNVVGLSVAQTYYFRLRTDDAGLTSYTSVTLYGQAPGIPTNLVATGNKSRSMLGTITLSWTAPENVGGLPVTSYEIARYLPLNEGAKGIVNVGNVTSYTISDLTHGQEYFFQVRALNSAGAGEWSPVNDVHAHSWGYNMQTFYGSGTWTWPLSNTSGTFDVLIVGGGGGGGMGLAGGGGGGGEVWWYENLFLNSATTPTATVIVGGGGTAGNNGGDSSFGGLIAKGGGAGGVTSGAHAAGVTGGSGGGGSKYDWGGGTPIVNGGAAGSPSNAGFTSASFINNGGNGWEGPSSNIITGGGGGGAGSIGKTDSVSTSSYSTTPSLGGEGILLEVSLGNYMHVGAGGGGAIFMRGSQTEPGLLSGGAGWGGGNGARINENQVMISAPTPSGQYGAGGGGGASYFSAVYNPTAGYQGIVRIGYYY